LEMVSFKENYSRMVIDKRVLGGGSDKKIEEDKVKVSTGVDVNVTGSGKTENKHKPHLHLSHHHHHKLSFKNKHFKPKYSSGGRTLKSLMVNPIDLMTYNTYINAETGPSVNPKIKYCDITGFKTNYFSKASNIRYYNQDIFRILKELPEPIINQYLTIRKAGFTLK